MLDTIRLSNVRPTVFPTNVWRGKRKAPVIASLPPAESVKRIRAFVRELRQHTSKL